MSVPSGGSFSTLGTSVVVGLEREEEVEEEEEAGKGVEKDRVGWSRGGGGFWAHVSAWSRTNGRIWLSWIDAAADDDDDDGGEGVVFEAEDGERSDGEGEAGGEGSVEGSSQPPRRPIAITCWRTASSLSSLQRSESEDVGGRGRHVSLLIFESSRQKAS